MRRHLLAAIICSQVLVVSAPLQSSESVSDAPYVIINKGAVGEKIDRPELSLQELIDIFTKRKTRWEDGSEIIVITQKINSPANVEFILSTLGMTPYQYRNRLYKNLYRGKSSAPIEVSSEEEMFDRILNNENAIGYIYDYMIIKKSNKIVILAVTGA